MITDTPNKSYLPPTLEEMARGTPNKEGEVFSAYEWQIEQGVREIVKLATKTILVVDEVRDAKVEDAIRKIIEAHAKAAVNSEALALLDRLESQSVTVLPETYPTGNRTSIDAVPTSAIRKEREQL